MKANTNNKIDGKTTVLPRTTDDDIANETRRHHSTAIAIAIAAGLGIFGFGIIGYTLSNVPSDNDQPAIEESATDYRDSWGDGVPQDEQIDQHAHTDTATRANANAKMAAQKAAEEKAAQDKAAADKKAADDKAAADKAAADENARRVTTPSNDTSDQSTDDSGDGSDSGFDSDSSDDSGDDGASEDCGPCNTIGMNDRDWRLAVDTFNAYNDYRESVGLNRVAWSNELENAGEPHTQYQIDHYPDLTHRVYLDTSWQSSVLQYDWENDGEETLTGDYIVSNYVGSEGHRRQLVCPSTTEAAVVVMNHPGNHGNDVYATIVYNFTDTNVGN